MPVFPSMQGTVPPGAGGTRDPYPRLRLACAAPTGENLPSGTPRASCLARPRRSVGGWRSSRPHRAEPCGWRRPRRTPRGPTRAPRVRVELTPARLPEQTRLLAGLRRRSPTQLRSPPDQRPRLHAMAPGDHLGAAALRKLLESLSPTRPCDVDPSGHSISSGPPASRPVR